MVVSVGQSYAIARAFTADDVKTFANLTGDSNEVHLSDEAAKRAGFDGTLVHGMLVASLFSRIMGMHLPGPGSIYMQQSINFRAPVYVGDEVTASVTVAGFDVKRGNITFDTKVVTAAGALAIDGKALGRNRVVGFSRQDDSGAVETFPPVSSR
jgi:acyl dehydratase